MIKAHKCVSLLLVLFLVTESFFCPLAENVSKEVLSPKSIFPQLVVKKNKFYERMTWLFQKHKAALLSIVTVNLGIGIMIDTTRSAHPFLQPLLQIGLVLPWTIWMTIYGDKMAQRAERMDKTFFDAERGRYMKWVAIFSRGVEFTWVVFALGPISKLLLESLLGITVDVNDSFNLAFGGMKYFLDQVVFLPVYFFVSFFVKSFIKFSGKNFISKFIEDLKPREKGLKGLLFSGGFVSTWFISWAISLVPFLLIFTVFPVDLAFIPLSLFNIVGAIVFSVLLNMPQKDLPQKEMPLFSQEEIKNLSKMPLEERARVFVDRLKTVNVDENMFPAIQKLIDSLSIGNLVSIAS